LYIKTIEAGIAIAKNGYILYLSNVETSDFGAAN